MSTEEQNKQTALHRAAHNGEVEVVKLLLENMADIDAKDNCGSSALLLAASNGFCATVKTLLDKGADKTAIDDKGLTALHQAADNGAPRTATLLLNWGADITKKENNGQTSLHRAARNGCYYTTQRLLDSNANIAAVDNYKSTALHLAAENGMAGKTALDVASHENIRDVYKGRIQILETQRRRIIELLASENPGVMSYASIRELTRNFLATPARDDVIGKGAAWEVFEGLIVPPEGMIDSVCDRLVVKRMDSRLLQLCDVGEAHKSFVETCHRF
eukprot:gene25253-32952_t